MRYWVIEYIIYIVICWYLILILSYVYFLKYQITKLNRDNTIIRNI